MPYSVWVKVEDQMGQPGDRSEAWWQVPGEHRTRKDAVEWVESEMAKRHDLERLEDKWTAADDADEVDLPW